jgi:hypothetical protein
MQSMKGERKTMKNFKKVIALGSAVMMSLTMSVSAFAAAGTATASYKDGFVKLSGTEDINAENQWTVVVISKADQNATLTADKLYYINQGTSGDTFWTNGMGTKTELTEGEYIIRIGGETITSADDLIEIPLTIQSEVVTPTYTPGDCDGMVGITTNDATAIAKALVGSLTLTGDAALAADCDGMVGITTNDATAIAKFLVGSLGELQYAVAE